MFRWDQDLLAHLQGVGPGGSVVLHRQVGISAVKMQALVAGERAGQKVGFGEDLEAVTNAENRHAPAGGVDDGLHDRREGGNSAAAQVVAIRKTAWDNYRVDVFQVGVGVPQAYDFGSGETGGAGGVDIIKRAGECDYSDFCAHYAPMPRKSRRSLR